VTRTGDDYIRGLDDGRTVFVNGERVANVATHPAFRGAVRSTARVYDLAHDSDDGVMTYTSSAAEPVNISFLIPRSKDDLTRRRIGLQRLSESTFGLMGRSPDHVASFLAGFAGNIELFARAGKEFGENVHRFYEWARDNDQYLTYVIAPPQIDRSKPAHQQSDPHLYAGVKEERDDGIVLAGAQMLGTGTAISDWVLFSNIVPLGPGDENYAVTAVIPLSAPGLRIHSRRSYAQAANSEFDYPLSTRFDEGDSLVVFDDAFVPWENVFVYRDLDIVRDQWWNTAAHVLGNNQAQIRLWTKLEFLLGLARSVAEMNGVMIPPIQAVLGEMAAHVTLLQGLVVAQEQNAFIDEHGVAWPGPAEVHACSTLQVEFYPKLLGMVRELCGGGLIQLPSSREDFANPEIAGDLDRYVQSPGTSAVERVKLMKLVWDIVGSEFAGRHHQYELFYAGAPHLVKARMFRQYDFSRAMALVAAARAGYDLDTSSEAG